ncbi:hypothetical protein V5O48_015204 [Marasmius crinis-equi]|uniref:Uncharacterized protein n=1 Tax=Marasmius crinis-equi TaxID=585013 RepID=A0ABR3EV67_9AGAR
MPSHRGHDYLTSSASLNPRQGGPSHHPNPQHSLTSSSTMDSYHGHLHPGPSGAANLRQGGRSNHTQSLDPPPLLPMQDNTAPRTPVDPMYIEAWTVARDRARRNGEDSVALGFELILQQAQEGLKRPNNWLEKPYSPRVHGPIRRFRLNGDTGLEFVYYDTNLGQSKYIFGCTIMPPDYEPPAKYNWRQMMVKVYSVDGAEDPMEIGGDALYMKAMVGQKLLIRVPGRGRNPHTDTVVQMEWGTLASTRLPAAHYLTA